MEEKKNTEITNEAAQISETDEKASEENAAGQAAGIQPEHGKAVASLVLGIIGLAACGPCAVLAIIFGGIAKKAGNTETICKAGWIMGIIGTCLFAAGLLIAIIFLFACCAAYSY